ncbi:MAG TPA: alpha-2-macroglobulin family protein, partial [Verrucomicrobiae bacterium]
ILYAVDDGILGLSGYTLPDPYAFFFADRPLGVQTSISLPNLLSEDPEQLEFQNKGYLGGGGGRERVRKNFLACAFWNADLQTDANGKVHAVFTAPDSLTRYRLFAVAHTGDSHFGSSQSAFHVTKPLVIEPALPAFANITDHLQARGVILNQTTNAGAIVVSLDLDDKASATNTTGSTLTQQVFVPANGSATVDFPIELTDTGETKWVWHARFADSSISAFTDSVQSTIPIGHIAPLLGEVLLRRVSTGQSNLLALANPQLLGGRGTITINVANTRLNELGKSATELLHYPYGCAEQTGSSLLPWILLRDTPGLLPDRLGSKTNDASAAIRAGVARLLSMQTSSGGLGYWPRAKEPMLWASAYGGMVLAIAQRHGIAVPKEELDSLFNFLSQQLRSDGVDADELSDQCLALYALALAGRAEPAFQEKLYSRRERLATEDQALLALAIAESQGPNGMIADLLHATSPQATVESRFGCPTRAEAIRLLAWIHYLPADPTVDRLVSDLMQEQKQAHWETTQGNAWALLALTDYAQLVETKLQPAQGQITYGDQSVDFVLNDHTNVFSQTFVIQTNTVLRVSQSGTNVLYTT